MDGKKKQEHWHIKKAKNTTEAEVEVGCTVIQMSALFHLSTPGAVVWLQRSSSPGSMASPARLLHTG